MCLDPRFLSGLVGLLYLTTIPIKILNKWHIHAGWSGQITIIPKPELRAFWEIFPYLTTFWGHVGCGRNNFPNGMMKVKTSDEFILLIH